MTPKARSAVIARTTKETDIRLELVLDGSGATDISTGIGFADHMLTLLAYWAGFDLKIACTGDLEVDGHHTLEDVGLCLGEALATALGDKSGIARVGWAFVPMDESLARVVVDLSGRPYLVYRDDCLPHAIGGEEKDLYREFFKSVSYKAGMNLHIDFEYGLNGHHLLEAGFKAAGLALAMATGPAAHPAKRAGAFSTKGSLD